MADVYISSIAMILHFFSCYFFICYMHLGIVGAGYAMVFTHWANLLVVLCYFKISGLISVLKEWDLIEAFKDWAPMLSLGIPGVAMYMIEWWAFESSTIFAGAAGGDHLAAHIAVINTFELMEMITLGVSSAASTIVGNKIGENQPDEARKMGYAAILFSLILCTVTNFLLVSFRNVWAQLCTNDVDVSSLIMLIIPLYCLAQFSDAINDVVVGIITGVGHQKKAAVGNILGYYVIGLPCMYYLALEMDMGVLGIWIGILIGNICGLTMQLVVLGLIDWKKEADLASKREVEMKID